MDADAGAKEHLVAATADAEARDEIARRAQVAGASWQQRQRQTPTPTPQSEDHTPAGATGEADLATGAEPAVRLRVWLRGPRAARGVAVAVLCRHEGALRAALRIGAARLRLEQWPALLALARSVDLRGGRAGLRRSGGGGTTAMEGAASLLLLRAMLTSWPAAVCLQLLRRQPSLADALPIDGFSLLLRAARSKSGDQQGRVHGYGTASK